MDSGADQDTVQGEEVQMTALGDRPAFPRNGIPAENPGMSLRQWLAGQALSNLASIENLSPDKAAAWAVEFADATLKELAKEEV